MFLKYTIYQNPCFEMPRIPSSNKTGVQFRITSDTEDIK